MQKNWYIVYTKEKCEKKVSDLLTKKKIENFCPVNCRQIKQFNRIKSVYVPLFNSYVFACVPESDIELLKQISHVVNIVYWKGVPAVIQNEEIEEIREFVADFQNIQLEKSNVILNSEPSLIDRPAYAIDGNMVMIKSKSVKVNIPSLGFTMIAKMNEKGVVGREITFYPKNKKEEFMALGNK